MSGQTGYSARRWLFGALAVACASSSGAAQQESPQPRPPAVPAPAGSAGAAAPAAGAPAGVTPPPGSPTVDRSNPVGLQEAIQVAYQNHGTIAAAEEQVEAARQRVRQARTGTLPTIRGELNYQGRGTNNLFGVLGPKPEQSIQVPGQPLRREVIDTNSTTFDQGIQPRVAIGYNIYDGGQTRTQVRQARVNVEGSAAALAGTRNNLAFTVTTNYLLQLRAERLLELRIAQEQLAEEQLRRVEARIRAGTAAEAERAVVLSELRNRQVDRILAENDVRVNGIALRNSMGLPVGAKLDLVELRESDEALPPLDTLRDIARRERPEVIQDEAQTRVAQLGVSLARINRKPRLDTTFAFNVNPNNNSPRSDWAFGASLSMPLWDAGLTHAREQEARANVQSAAALLEQTRRDVTADVEQAYLTIINARERLQASRLAVEAARVNLEATTARYEVGAPGTTVLDLINAQVQFATANNNAIGALYDVYLAQAQLNRAIGRI